METLNEIKAKEIADKLGTDIFQNGTGKSYYKEDICNAALQAMQWKDKQIDTIMLTTEGCLRSFFESQGNTQESIDNFIDALKTQINENLNE